MLSLYSDHGGEHFHHHERNKQPPLTTNHLTQKRPQHICHWKSRYWLGTSAQCGRVEPVNEIPPPPPPGRIGSPATIQI